MFYDLQITHLRTLIAVVEEGSFAGAAERVGRTQSAVSQQMQKLEVSVGKPLFEADGRNRKLTPAGFTLVQYGREILSMSRHALRAISNASQGGLLRVGIPQELVDVLLPQALSTFDAAWPDIRVTLHVERSPRLMTMFNENRLEVVVTTRRQSYLDTTHIHSMQSDWIAPSHFQWDRTTPLPVVLSDEPSLFRRIALAALDLNSIPHVERFTSPSLAGLRPAVSAGLGVTVRPAAAFPGDFKIMTEEDGLPPLPKVLYYGYLTESSMHEAAGEFLEALKYANI